MKHYHCNNNITKYYNMSNLTKDNDPFFYSKDSVTRLTTKRLSIDEKKSLYDLNIENIIRYMESNNYSIRDLIYYWMNHPSYLHFQNFIKNLYITTRGNDLLQLKQYIDEQSKCKLNGDCFTNLNILYFCINVDNFREIIDHITTEGNRVRQIRPIVHTLTDIDDTVFVGGAGGTDSTYNKHYFYPGVATFHKEINNSRLISYLSARPNAGMGSFSEDGQRRIFNQYYTDGKMPYKAQMLLGDISGMLEGLDGLARDFLAKKLNILHISYVESPSSVNDIIEDLEIDLGINPCEDFLNLKSKIPNNHWTQTYASFGINKFISFCAFSRIYPEYNFIFLGDSGQGDMLASLLIAKHPQTKACLIKDLIRIKRQNFSRSKDGKNTWDIELVTKELRDELKTHNVLVFNNYIQAGMMLNNLDPYLCSKSKVKKIATAAYNEFINTGKQNIFKGLDWLIEHKEKEITLDYQCVKFGRTDDEEYQCIELRKQ